MTRARALAAWLVLALLAPVSAEGASDAPRPLVHEVRAGENLSAIARAHGCSLVELRAANRLREGSVIYRGQRLKIPECKGSRHVAADLGGSGAGGSTRGAAKGANAREQPASRALGAGAAGASSSESERIRHKVQRGESLARVAKIYGISTAELRQQNRLRGDTIHPGMDLWIPRGGRGGAGRFEAPIVRGQSVGRPNHGKLVNGVQMPAGKGYYLRRSARAWAAEHTVAYVRHAIEVTRQRHPRLHKLAIGDLSRESGGALPGHRSHQSGRDVDLGLFYKKKPSEYPRVFVPAGPRSMNVAATWTLVEALLATRSSPGGVEHLFLDYELQRLLYEHARRQGASAESLAELFQYPHGREKGGTVIQHVPAHHDHIHARFKCPAGDPGCL
ncbi:MAG: penicillin-insensitive murein endopeptidase [Nannocystis sp.]|nr:penicillin-insensitive murein endopeptidase [Nannocystis sp.]